MGNFQKRGKIKYIRLTFALFLFFSVACACYASSEDEALTRARQLVRDKSYREALELYAQISERLLYEPGLLIEWGRVYAYADEHRQAIAIFEKVRAEHPQYANDILRELAEQYKWDDQNDKAIGVYSLALEADAHDINALLGKAEALSWDDRLEEALILYEKILDKDPQNLNALNGRARIYVWQGYHRRGAKEYKKITGQDQQNLDALEGLAFAYHWDGQDLSALETLEKLFSLDPARIEGRRLYDKINHSQYPYLTGHWYYSYDKNKLSIFSQGLRSGLRFSSRSSFSAIYQRQKLTQPGEKALKNNRAGISLGHKFNDLFELNSFLYGTKFNGAGFTAFTTNTWLTFRPDDIWRFDLSYDRQTYEDIEAIESKVIVNSGSFAFDLRPNRRWLVSTRYSRSLYSDNNRQDSVLAKLEYRIMRKPYIKAYYNYYFSDWAQQKENGYFNPFSLQSHSAGFYGGSNFGERLFLEAQLSAGYEKQNPALRRPVYFGALGLNYRIWSQWHLSLRAEYFDARPDKQDKGYSKKSVYLSMTYNFGGAAGRVLEGTRAARPIAGE